MYYIPGVDPVVLEAEEEMPRHPGVEVDISDQDIDDLIEDNTDEWS